MGDGESVSKRLQPLSEADLIDAAGGYSQVHAMEMRRRSAVATRELTSAVGELRNASDKAASRLLVATWALVALTAMLVVATVALLLKQSG